MREVHRVDGLLCFGLPRDVTRHWQPVGILSSLGQAGSEAASKTQGRSAGRAGGRGNNRGPDIYFSGRGRQQADRPSRLTQPAGFPRTSRLLAISGGLSSDWIGCSTSFTDSLMQSVSIPVWGGFLLLCLAPTPARAFVLSHQLNDAPLSLL